MTMKKAVDFKSKKIAWDRARGYFEDHPIIYKDFWKVAQKQE